MNQGQNGHLNLFNFFGVAKQYLENNVSRAFAIILQNEPMVLKGLIELITGKNYCEVIQSNGFPDNDVEIDIQRRMTSFDVPSEIYGVTIATQKYPFTTLSKPFNTAYPPITDISISVNDVLFIIEVKPHDEPSCVQQVQEQVNCLLQTNNCSVVPKYKSLKWEDILSLVECAKWFNEGIRSNYFLDNFIDFISAKFPGWTPCKPLDKFEFDKQSLPIGKRIKYIKQMVCEELYPNTGLLGGRGVKDGIPVSGNKGVSIDWAAMFDIELLDGSPRLSIRTWVGDTCAQGRLVFQNTKKRAILFPNEFPKGASIQISGDSYKFNMQPYVKYSSFSKGLAWLNLSEDKLLNKPIDLCKLFQDIHGRRELAKVGNKKGFELSVKNNLDKIDPAWEGNTDWIEAFVKTQRKIVNVSLGIEVSVDIDYPEAQKLDAKDDLIKKIAEIIREMKKEIVKRFGL